MDDEVGVMFQVGKTLEGLDEDARARVIRWAADKFGVDVGQPLAADDELIDNSGQTAFMSVDAEKVAAAKAARDSGEATAAVVAKLEPDAVRVEPDEPPPDRNPEKPSFLDTSFRMYSGKKELKKAKGDKK